MGSHQILVKIILDPLQIAMDSPVIKVAGEVHMATVKEQCQVLQERYPLQSSGFGQQRNRKEKLRLRLKQKPRIPSHIMRN